MTIVTPDTVSLDDCDRNLVTGLQHAPRAPFDVLGRAFGTSARTVARHYARLADSGLLRVIGELDWTVHTEGVPLLVWLRAEPGRAPDVANALAERADTTFVALGSGREDVFCMVHAPTRTATAHALTTGLPAIDGVAAIRSDGVLRRLTGTSAWRLRELSPAEEAVLAPHRLPAGAASAWTLTAPERAVAVCLGEDARLSYSDVARKVGLTESTARRTVLSLLESGLVRPRVEIEPRLLGYEVEALITIQCPPKAAAQVARALVAHPSTRFLAVTAAAPLTAVSVFPDEDELAKFLLGEWPGAKGVSAMDATLLWQTVKRYWHRPGE